MTVDESRLTDSVQILAHFWQQQRIAANELASPTTTSSSSSRSALKVINGRQVDCATASAAFTCEGAAQSTSVRAKERRMWRCARTHISRLVAWCENQCFVLITREFAPAFWEKTSSRPATIIIISWPAASQIR